MKNLMMLTVFWSVFSLNAFADMWNDKYDLVKYFGMQVNLNIDQCDYRLKIFHRTVSGLLGKTKLTTHYIPSLYGYNSSGVDLSEKSQYRLLEFDIQAMDVIVRNEKVFVDNGWNSPPTQGKLVLRIYKSGIDSGLITEFIWNVSVPYQTYPSSYFYPLNRSAQAIVDKKIAFILQEKCSSISSMK
jgi:hypothetical protein